MEIISKYAGTCTECGEPYKRGDIIIWCRDMGARHPECAQQNLFTREELERAHMIADRLKFD